MEQHRQSPQTPPHQDRQPEIESAMTPRPSAEDQAYRGSGKLQGHVVLTAGDDVNGVAPGPIWTPLIPSTFAEDKVERFGANMPMQRAGQPEGVAPSYVFLASDDASYMTGHILHPNGGEIVNG